MPKPTVKLTVFPVTIDNAQGESTVPRELINSRSIDEQMLRIKLSQLPLLEKKQASSTAGAQNSK